MPKLTAKQQLFVNAKVAGRKNREAAIEAGYSGATASPAASRLMKVAHVRAAIAKGKRATAQMHATLGAQGKADDAKSDMPREHYDDPMVFLQDMMDNPKLSMSMRSRAAEQLMPYVHARIGEKGKKEKRTDAAHGVVKNTKFAPKNAPRTGTTGTVVPIRK